MGHEAIIWNLCSNHSHILLCGFKFFHVFLSLPHCHSYFSVVPKVVVQLEKPDNLNCYNSI